MKTLRELGSVKTLANQAGPLILMACVMLAFYLLSTFVPPGAITFSISLLALSMVIVTAIARVNDIGDRSGWNWSLRRIALITTGAAGVGLVLSGEPLRWTETMFHIGVALTWFTTPGMPPWWKYIAGKERHEVH